MTVPDDDVDIVTKRLQIHGEIARQIELMHSAAIKIATARQLLVVKHR